MANYRAPRRTERANFLLLPAERAALEELARRRETTMTSVVVNLVRQAARAEDVFPPLESDTTGQAAGSAAKVVA